MKKIRKIVLSRWPRRGSGLATVLVITAIMVTLAFTVVGLSFHHLSATTRLSNGVYAKNLAEAAIAKGIDQIIRVNDFGMLGGSNTTIKVTQSGAPGSAYGVLTFDAAEATILSNQLKIAQVHKSTNNIKSDAPLQGDGCKVPGYGVHFSAIGYCQGTVRQVDAVVYIPRFPWAIAASGAISSGGDLFLASVRDGGDPTKASDLLPGHLATNSAAGQTAVNLYGSNITINGDLQSHSGANVSTAKITGETRRNAPQVALPSLKISDYDTASKPGVQNLAETQSASKVSGYNRRNGNLICADGLNLDGGVVFVNGDLQVSGGLTGQGAIIVNGTTTIHGTSSFTGDNKVAVLSKGNVDFVGQAGNPSSMKGLIYSEGNVNAQYTKLRGTIVANDSSGSNGKISMTSSEFYQDSTVSNFTVGVTPPGGSTTTTTYSGPLPAGNIVLGGVGALIDSWTLADPATTAASFNTQSISGSKNIPYVQGGGGLATNRWSQGGGSLMTAPSPGGGYFTGLVGGEQVVVPASQALSTSLATNRFFDSAQKKFVIPIASTVTMVDGQNRSVPPGTYEVIIDGPKPSDFHYQAYTGAVLPISPADCVIKVGSNPEVAASDTATWQAQLQTEYVAAVDSLVKSKRGTGLNAIEKMIASSSASAQVSSDLMPLMATSQGRAMAQFDAALKAKGQVPSPANITFQDALDPAYVPPTSTTTGGGTTDVWSLNLNDNSLIPLADRIRVMYWKDTP